ncbi:hypothetical protein GCM10018779_34730 [Streptomyces griseocarneus]|nr:hypothetical protein GCM10018779_34730 [Streptomyces griseocarneus]
MVCAALALVSAVHAVGQRKPAWHVTGNWWRPLEVISAVVMQCVAGVARLMTSAPDGASLSVRVGCLLLLVLTFVFWRRAMLARNAYRPGPVDVRKLVASSKEVEPQVEGLTAQLRKYLSETNLYPPAALPAEAPAENFIDLLGDVDLEPKKLGTSLLRLFSQLRPKVAYTVHGVLREKSQEPKCGVTITVTSYAMRGSRTDTLWEDTWDAVVRAAGNWVMASLVPVTRAGTRPPWQAWRGRDLKPELFAAYQDGRRLSEERKFDDALERFYMALRYDPANLYLRTQVAGIQEKLWLFMDALETYHGAMLLDGCTNRQRQRFLARGRRDLRSLLRRRYRGWHEGLLEVRYRYAIVLGVGEQLAMHWCSDSDKRAHARNEIRQALTPAIADRHWKAFRGWTRVTKESPEEDEAERIRKWLIGLLKRHEEEWLIRLVFQQACVEEMQRLAWDIPWFHLLPFGRSRYRGTLTRTSLRLNRKVWAPLRLAWAWGDGRPKEVSSIAGMPRAPRWIGDAKQLDRRVRRVRDGPAYPLKQWMRDCIPWPRRPWQDSYNTACVYAAAMNLPECDREPLAVWAVGELEDAARVDRRGSHSVMRSWLLVHDPDLVLLRKAQEPRFIRFEREVYPHSSPDHHRQVLPVAAEITAYHRRILQNAAQVMEHMWRLRRKQLLAEPHVVAEWFSSDREMWDCVYQFAKNGGSDWRDRERLLQELRRIAEPHLLSQYGLPPSLPELDDLLDEAARFAPDGARDRVEELVGKTVKRLDDLSSALRVERNGAKNSNSPIIRSEQWLTSVRENPTLSIVAPRSAAWHVCWDYEEAWHALGEELNFELEQDIMGRPQEGPLQAAVRNLRAPPKPWPFMRARAAPRRRRRPSP